MIQQVIAPFYHLWFKIQLRRNKISPVAYDPCFGISNTKFTYHQNNSNTIYIDFLELLFLMHCVWLHSWYRESSRIMGLVCVISRHPKIDDEALGERNYVRVRVNVAPIIDSPF